MTVPKNVEYECEPKFYLFSHNKIIMNVSWIEIVYQESINLLQVQDVQVFPLNNALILPKVFTNTVGSRT